MRNDHNTVALLLRYLSILNINISEKSLTSEIERHPDFPSIKAFSDVFDHFKIPNGAAELQSQELKELSAPFIAGVNARNGGFVLVERIYNDQIYITKSYGVSIDLTLGQFFKIFNNYIFIASPNDHSIDNFFKENNRKKKLEAKRIPIVIALLVFGMVSRFAVVYYEAKFDAGWLILIALKIAGLFVAVLLLIQSFDKNNAFAKLFCKKNSSGGCQDLLSTSAAYLTKGISWAEIGFLYFAGTLGILLFSIGKPYFAQILFIGNILCLPYTFFSVYYQMSVKKWCRLCCITQAIFWGEFFIFLNQGLKFEIVINYWFFLQQMVVALIPVALWVFVKPYLLSVKDLKLANQQLNSLKYDETVFWQKLNSIKGYTMLNEQDVAIIGNIEAKQVLTVVFDPFCPACARAHHEIDNWLEINSNLQVRVVFNTSNNSDNESVLVARHLYSIYLLKGQQAFNQAIKNWHSLKEPKYHSWKEHFVTTILNEAEMVVSRQQAWCEEMQIFNTPSVFIGSQRLPLPWVPRDLKYFLM